MSTRHLPTNGRGITLDEVARVAGVSRATVSRVVNGKPEVRRDARRAVERAVEELGYVPNAAARSLVTRRSDSIGVVITEPGGRLFVDPFFPRLLRGVGAELASRELQLVLVMPGSAEEERRAERYLT
ncbi:MAG TPA: LacI family DNA-binding transcriptional regulator, partial [Candidatus Limnocylindrales bacterium]